MAIDAKLLRIELLRVGLTLTGLAKLLGHPPTTLSSWVHGAHPAPPDLEERIARVLADAATPATKTGPP